MNREELIDYYKANLRVCPLPPYWAKFHQTLLSLAEFSTLTAEHKDNFGSWIIHHRSYDKRTLIRP